jgi:hypothetical protein
MRKKFSQALYDQNDQLATGVISGYLAQWGLVAEPNPNRYGVDLLVRKPDEPDHFLAVECEIKRVWTGDSFPYQTIQLPERKGKYRNVPQQLEYWILNADCTSAIIIPEFLLDEHKPVVVPNKYIRWGEKFYQLPIDECVIIQIREGNE